MTFLAVAIVLALIVWSTYALWLDHEEAKADRLKQRRKELDAAMSLSHDFPPRGPKGWNGRGKKAA